MNMHMHVFMDVCMCMCMYTSNCMCICLETCYVPTCLCIYKQINKYIYICIICKYIRYIYIIFICIIDSDYRISEDLGSLNVSTCHNDSPWTLNLIFRFQRRPTATCQTKTCWSALGSAWETLPQFGRQSLLAHHLIEVMPPLNKPTGLHHSHGSLMSGAGSLNFVAHPPCYQCYQLWISVDKKHKKNITQVQRNKTQANADQLSSIAQSNLCQTLVMFCDNP